MQNESTHSYEQTTSHILMIRPARFAFNEQTADSNAFQDPAARDTARMMPVRMPGKAASSMRWWTTCAVSGWT